ncbi:vWA domain-containing protein [Tsukamurella spumae]|uniref:VWFA domain-containing protein n=1 Tax=Tsukamurella spumae TaxID=44753 RepID=A0A846X0I4_9ACTN|nr:VWA domain-containing protein [Tsukamurella spumae]NKY17470.1 hypothetical protein [Tsukamurella spumae]
MYFVADESGSMGPHIHELNEGLVSLQDAMQVESFAAAKIRFSVIGFADDAVTYLEPADLRTLPHMPSFRARGLTSYQAVFDQIGYRISVDVPNLKAQGYQVHRPAVFFLTDGVPNRNEDWRAARDYMLAQPAAPNVLAFGIGEVDAATIVEIATQPHYAFISSRGMDTGVAISEFMTQLTQSVIASGNALAGGAGALQLEKPEGFSLAVDYV